MNSIDQRKNIFDYLINKFLEEYFIKNLKAILF